MNPKEIGQRAQSAYEDLTEREQRLVMLLGVVVALIVVVLPLFLLTSALSDMEEENAALRQIMRDIEQARPRLARAAQEREMTRQRYENAAPSLGGFMEQKANAQGLSLRQINDQPEVHLGDFMRRGVQVSIPDVEIDPVLTMLRTIEDSGHPIAISKLQIDRYRNEGHFNVEIGVSAYDRERGGGSGEQASGGRGRRR